MSLSDDWSNPRYLDEYERRVWEFEESLEHWRAELRERLTRDLGSVKRLGTDAQGPRQQAHQGHEVAGDGETEDF